MDPLPEPTVTLQVGGTPVQFLVDTGAQHSVLVKPHGKVSEKSSWVQGATGKKKIPLDNSEDCGLGNWEGNPLLPGHSRQPLPPVGEGFAYRNGGPKFISNREDPQ